MLKNLELTEQNIQLFQMFRVTVIFLVKEYLILNFETGFKSMYPLHGEKSYCCPQLKNQIQYQELTVDFKISVLIDKWWKKHYYQFIAIHEK